MVGAALSLACAFATEAYGQRGTPADPYEWFLLIPQPTSDITRREIIEATNAFSDYTRMSGLGSFRGSFFDTLAELDAFIRARRSLGKPPIYGVLDAMPAIQRAAEWGVTPFLCSVYKGKTTAGSVVVVSRSHPAKSVSDLKGERIAVVKMLAEAPDVLGLTLFQDAVKPQGFFREIVPVASQRDCLIAVSRRQADAALVLKPFFEAVQRRDREAWKEYRVLAELPEQHLGVFVVFNETPAALADAFKILTLNAKQSEAGRHIIDLFEIDGFQSCAMADFEEPELRLLSKLGTGGGPLDSARGRQAPALRVPTGSQAVAPAATSAQSTKDRGAEVEEAASDLAPVASVEVERDADSGDVSAVVTFKKLAPRGVKALVALDDGPDEIATLECQASICVLTLPAERVNGKRRLSLVLLMEKDGKSLRLGRKKTYSLGG